MRKTAATLTLILALLASTVATTLQAGYYMPLPPDAYIIGDTVVYTITGRGLNVSIMLDLPENKAYNSTVTFTLKVLESFSAGAAGNDPVNPNDYWLSPKTLDVYLISGAILDYDRAKVIDPVWIHWGNTKNATYMEEERALFLNSYDVVFSKSEGTYFGSAVLPELSQGTHNLTVWVRAEHDEVTTYIPLWSAFSKTISFTIDTVAPRVLFLVPNNSTYETPEILLNFTVSEPFSKIEYSLDGQSNVTISGNATLTGLPNGYHNVMVYATDEAGNTGASETISFTFAVPDPFPVVPVAAASTLSAAVVCVGVFFCLRKRKR